MPRRGGRTHNEWTKPNNRAPRPHGLRGRDIGLFYRNQQMKNKGQKIQKDIIIQFTVPPAVITGLGNNIKVIKELAKKANIPITYFKGVNLVNNVKKEENIKGDDFSVHNNMFKSYIPTAGPSTSGYNHGPDIGKVNSQPTDEIQQDKNSGTKLNYGIKKIKVEIMGDAMQNIKIEPIDDLDEKAAVPNLTKNIKQEPDSEEYGTKLLEPKSEPMDVTSSDLECPEDTSNERLLSLRGAGDFKYGYEDIITGTFDEKLDESISKGLAITKKTAENDDLSFALYQDYQNMLNKDGYKKLMQFRQTLPTFKKSEELLDVLNAHQVVVISGETGCGKSTQIPQLILDEAVKNKKGAYVKILVTQPRRIAASSLAMRVAQERSEAMGASVGYAVRLENVDARARGSIMFCTTGILLATLEVDQGLSNYSHVIIDEVHERDCDIDIALYVLKKVIKKRKDLKVILMSATIDSESLARYYNDCPIIHIEGLAFPVKDVYMEDILEMVNFKLPVINQSKNAQNLKPWERYKKKKIADDMEKDIQYKAQIGPWLESVRRKIKYDVYKTLQDSRIEELNIDLIYQLIVHICKGPPGAILVFLPGIAEISKLLRMMQTGEQFPNRSYQIYPLHSKLPSLQQHMIFERPPPNVRKIIVATNIAETSITVDDIVYVVDCGKMKYVGLNVEDNISTLEMTWITKANLRQRRGRAGRCQPGICYHLLTSHRAENLAERLLPTIQRDPLLEPVLTIKRLRLGLAAEALGALPAPPAPSTIHLAVRHLQQCGALKHDEKLTPLGWHLARLPVHPAAGKLLLLGSLFGCLDRAASVAAVWGFKDPFQLVIGKEDEVDRAKKLFGLGEGSDHVAISEAIIQWEDIPSESQRRDFAYNNFLAHNTLVLLSDMKRQLGMSLKNMGFLPSGDVNAHWENRNTHNLSLFKAIVAASLYPNVMTAKWANMNARNPNKVVKLKARSPQGFIFIHPSSVMAVKNPIRKSPQSPVGCLNPGAQWVVYWHKQQSTKLYLLEVTVIHTLPLLFFGEMTVTEGTDQSEYLISIASVKVRCKKETAELLFQMRCFLDQVLATKIGTSSDHATTRHPFEDQVLNAVKELITAEDERAECLDDDDDPSESDLSEYESTSWRR